MDLGQDGLYHGYVPNPAVTATYSFVSQQLVALLAICMLVTDIDRYCVQFHMLLKNSMVM
jgi:hypothetical protein